MPETPKDPKIRPTTDKPASSESIETHTLSLVKGGHHFCFRYETGDEPQVLEAMVEMVNRRELKFDWFDAAVLSHQLGQHLAKELRAYLPKKAA
jgi:hypothetical protein